MKRSAVSRKSRTAAAYGKYIPALLLFGSNGILAGHIHLASCQIVLLRTFFGSMLLLLIGIARHSLRGILQYRKDVLYVVLSGVCMGASWMFQYEAYRRIGVSITSLLYCLGPILVVILSQIAGRKSLSLKKILCLAAVTAGAVMTGGLSLQQNPDTAGIFCALMCAVTYTGLILLNKKSTAVTGLPNAILQLTAGFITVFVYNTARWISGSTPAIRLDVHEWIPVLMLGLLNTGVGCYLYFSGISEIPAQTVAVCDYLEPLTAVILSALILHESLSGWQLAGAVLIAGGTLAWNICPHPVNQTGCCKSRVKSDAQT